MGASLFASADGTVSTGGNSLDSEFGGCMDIWTGFSIVGGCDGTFFDVFQVSVSNTLYSGDWDIFQVRISI